MLSATSKPDAESDVSGIRQTGATMPRVHAVAYDVTPSSPAQPRVSAFLRELVRRGADVRLWTARAPGPWGEELAVLGRFTVHVVVDPVRRTYDSLRRLGSAGARDDGVTSADTVGVADGRAAAAPRTGGILWRIGSRIQSAILFPDHEVLWSRKVARRSRDSVGAGDVVLTFSRPESVGHVGTVAARLGARWWFDFADGWCFQGLRREAMKPGRRRERELALERRWVGAADVVSTVDEALAESFRALRPSREVLVFPNIVPDELVGPPRPEVATGEPLTVGYFGRISLSDPQRSLRPLLGLVRAALGDGRKVRFCFHGEFTARDRAEIGELAAMGHEVLVTAPLPRHELAARRANFDAMIVVGSPSQRGSSSKLLDAFGLELPVLALVPVPSVAERLVRESGAGEVVALSRHEPIGGASRQSWRDFLDGVRAGRYRMDPAWRDCYTSAAFVPALVDRVLGLAEAPGPQR